MPLGDGNELVLSFFRAHGETEGNPNRPCILRRITLGDGNHHCGDTGTRGLARVLHYAILMPQGAKRKGDRFQSPLIPLLP